MIFTYKILIRCYMCSSHPCPCLDLTNTNLNTVHAYQPWDFKMSHPCGSSISLLSLFLLKDTSLSLNVWAIIKAMSAINTSFLDVSVSQRLKGCICRCTDTDTCIVTNLQALQKHQINYSFTWVVLYCCGHLSNDLNAWESDLISLAKKLELREMSSLWNWRMFK